MSAEEIKNYLSEHYHLSPEQAESMMPSFLSALRSHMNTLENAVREGNEAQMCRAGHTIKGAFLNLGLGKCAQIALDIEESAKGANSSVDYTSKLEMLRCLLAPVLTPE